MTLLLAGIAFDAAQVFGLILILLCYLGGIDPSGWITSPSTTPVFFGGLGLRLIGGGGIMGLSLIFVLVGGLVAGRPIGVLLVFLGQRAMTFRALEINYSNIEGWLQVSLCFYITYLFHHFFPRV